MFDRLPSHPLLACLIAVISLSMAVAGPADCKKTQKLYESIPLESWSGGSMIHSLDRFDLDDAQWLTAGAGQTRATGEPWRASSQPKDVVNLG